MTTLSATLFQPSKKELDSKPDGTRGKPSSLRALLTATACALPATLCLARVVGRGLMRALTNCVARLLTPQPPLDSTWACSRQRPPTTGRNTAASAHCEYYKWSTAWNWLMHLATGRNHLHPQFLHHHLVGQARLFHFHGRQNYSWTGPILTGQHLAALVLVRFPNPLALSK